MLHCNMHQTAFHITQSVEQRITITNKLMTSKTLQHIKFSTEHRNPVIKNGAVANLKATVPPHAKLPPSIDH